MCFQTCCTPKTKVEVRLQWFWLMEIVQMVQWTFKHAHLISIYFNCYARDINCADMHADCKPLPSRSPSSFKLHGLAMESKISGSNNFCFRNSISISFTPHLSLACSVALAMWTDCVLIITYQHSVHIKVQFPRLLGHEYAIYAERLSRVWFFASWQ